MDNNINNGTGEEALALLKYMTHHTEHHIEELKELSHTLSDEASENVDEAVCLMEQACEKLMKALDILE